MYARIASAALLALAACSNGEGAPKKTAPQKAPSNVEADSVAYFAGGCFWGVEHYLEKMPGVASVESGYMGGHVEDPGYDDVLTKESGHYETVRVRYDADMVSYEQLARRFFEIHDPTQADGQGPDIGPQYRSAVFYGSQEEKQITQKLISILRERGYDVVTELLPAKTFWPAEEYHQDYYARKEDVPYCHRRIMRFGKDAETR